MNSIRSIPKSAQAATLAKALQAGTESKPIRDSGAHGQSAARHRHARQARPAGLQTRFLTRVEPVSGLKLLDFSIASIACRR